MSSTTFDLRLPTAVLRSDREPVAGRPSPPASVPASQGDSNVFGPMAPHAQRFDGQLERRVGEIRAQGLEARKAAANALGDYLGRLDAAAPADVAEQFARMNGVELAESDAEKVGTELKAMLKGAVAEAVRMLEPSPSPARQWAKVLRNAWKGGEAIRTLGRLRDWRKNPDGTSLAHSQLGARWGNVGDLGASALGVTSAVGSVVSGGPGAGAMDAVRLLITPSGVTGGYVNDRVTNEHRVHPDNAELSNLQKAIRPYDGGDANRSGFLAYTPAAAAFLLSGVVRNMTAENTVELLGHEVNVAGMADVVGGAMLMAGFMSVILLDDPRNGEILERYGPKDFALKDDGIYIGGERRRLKIGETPDLVVKGPDGKDTSMSLFEYLDTPDTERAELRELLIRKSAATDILNKAVNPVVGTAATGARAVKSGIRFLGGSKAKVEETRVDYKRLGNAAKGGEWGRFQLLTLFCSFTTYTGWAMVADRFTGTEWDQVAVGLAEGPASPNFWGQGLTALTFALQLAATAAYTKTQYHFARA